MRNTLLSYIHVLWTQPAQTARVNAAFVVEIRRARWILMCQDRLQRDDLRLTHRFLAIMLAVRCPRVAIHVLEERRLIRARRFLTVLDRPGLLALARSLPMGSRSRIRQGDQVVSDAGT